MEHENIKRGFEKVYVPNKHGNGTHHEWACIVCGEHFRSIPRAEAHMLAAKCNLREIDAQELKLIIGGPTD
jgi:hypothetical protein